MGNNYGTPRAYWEEKLSEGRDVILEIEIQGARRIREQFPDAVLLFVTTKDIDTLRERLDRRGTGSGRVRDEDSRNHRDRASENRSQRGID